ncbi:uncharacterized protein BDZ99DRAFT_518658 [Mytilinidion resinicola]|uniref:Low temperature requirement A n=1 Tax=Mytilinidion resinicola TaxID=574789 RepID=A0A6A6YS94_9PEZI|nr:uncharacterized protein BDZ99DRAFT_518658 [Mytilinidion resinicola]KAF2811379.1 hypothetical protein BDZ99DRAFT_518658 [Mytilinidion resinicola]
MSSLEKYFFKRPRALQYVHAGREYRHGDAHETGNDHALLPSNTDASGETRSKSDAKSIAHPDSTTILHRTHLDLFIDLIFVGIVGNIAEHTSERLFVAPEGHEGTSADAFKAILEFTLEFLLTWRIWNYLRNFTNMFFQDDLTQRMFIIWILILALIFGNNVSYTFVNYKGASFTFSIYLIIRGSFFYIEGIYCLFIRWMWKEWLLSTITSLPATGLWIGAIFATGWAQLGLVMGALFIDYTGAIFRNSPLLDRLLSKDYRKTPDLDHYVERISSFYVIILGEGVLNLIKGSPLGEGLTAEVGSGIATLAMYFILHMLYFKSQASGEGFRAVRMSHFQGALWQLAHVLIFGALLLLDVSNLFLVTHQDASALDPPESEPTSPEKRRRLALFTRASTEEPTEEELPHYVRVGLYTSSGALAIVLFGITVITLLHSSQFYKAMKNKTLLDHPFIRAIPRVILIIIFPCLPLMGVQVGRNWLAIAVGSLSALTMLELFMAYRRCGSGVVEPAPKGDGKHNTGTRLKTLSTVSPQSRADAPESPVDTPESLRDLRHRFTA